VSPAPLLPPIRRAEFVNAIGLELPMKRVRRLIKEDAVVEHGQELLIAAEVGSLATLACELFSAELGLRCVAGRAACAVTGRVAATCTRRAITDALPPPPLRAARGHQHPGGRRAAPAPSLTWWSLRTSSRRWTAVTAWTSCACALAAACLHWLLRGERTRPGVARHCALDAGR
jgi:hypothetical protein